MRAITEGNRRWWILVAMTGCLSMTFIDQTVVGVALPTIQRDLGMSQSELQWVVNAYMLALAALVAVGGRLGEMFGQARMLKLGGVIFIVASAFCGLAQSDIWLIAARAVEGAGAALMIPPSGAIVINTFSVKERGRAMGIYAGISLIFLALGPLLGGVLTDSVSWRAIFYINLPLGLAMLALTHAAVPRDQPAAGARMDVRGMVALVAGLTALVLALMQSTTWGWGSPAVIGLLVTAAILLPLFVALESRVREPLVQLKLFASRNFSGDVVVLATAQFALTGITVFGAIWTQNALRFSPTTSGLALLPLTIPLLFIAPLSGRAYDRTGPRLLTVTGSLLFAGGLVFNAAVMSKLSYPWIVPGLVAMGVGVGLVMTPANTDAMNSAAAKFRGEASGVIQMFRQVGGTIGLAAMGTVVAHTQAQRITTIATANGATPTQASHYDQVLSGGSASLQLASHHVSPTIIQELREALTTAISSAYYLAGGVVLLGGLVALLVLRRVRAADQGDDVGAAERLSAPPVAGV